MLCDRLRIVLQPVTPVALDRGQGAQTLALARPVEGDAGEGGEESPVFVFDDQDAIPPAVEAEVEGWLITPQEAGIGVVDPNTITVADDPVGGEEEAQRDGATVVFAARPGQDAVIIAKFFDPPPGLVYTVRALRVDQCLEEVGGDNEIRLCG